MRSKFSTVSAIAIGLLFVAVEARATSITISDATPTYTVVRPTCSRAGIDYINCTVNAFLDDVSLTSDTSVAAAHGASEFKKSFDAWVATPQGTGWTLLSAAGLADLAIDVTIFDAQAFVPNGGVEMSMNWTYGAAGAGDKTNYYWAQGLFDNYLLNGSIVTPFYEMDVFSDAACAADPLAFCAPLYPFQYVDRHFYDFPLAPWPSSFFIAEAFIAQADYTNKQLTIYDGVNYGFRLSATQVPEPTTALLVLVGVAILGRRRWRRGRAA